MARPDVNTTVGADTRRLESDVRAALNKDYKVKLQSRGFSQPLGKIRGQLGEFEKSLEASNARVLAFGASAGAIVAVQQALKATVSSAINVEKKLKDINVILGASAKNLAAFGDQLFKIAGDTGQAFNAVADAAAEFARQGLGLEQTLLRTRDALILTRLSGLDVVTSVNSLTAAINSFGRAALNSTEIVNKLANVDAAFAVSSADLANALSRVGSAAEDAGVSFDELLAIVTATQQTTARGGAVIGNSLKTIFTRIQRPKVLEELERLGLTVRDLEGETRPAIQILGELAKTFDGLSSSQRSQVGELVGGVFQINILKAALSDLNKEYSIYDNALQTSISSTDQALKRNEALNETLSSLVNKTFANLQKTGAKVGENVFGPSIKTVLNSLNTALEGGDSESLGEKFGQSFFKGIGKFISGPGLVLIGATLTKVFINLGRFAVDALKAVQNLNIQSAEQRKLQAGITNILDDQPLILEKIRTGELKIEDAAELVLGRYKAQQAILRQNLDIVKRIQSMGAGRGGSGKASGGKKAGGHVPRFAGGSIVDLERRDARMGGYTAGEVIASPIGGVMNTAETISYDSRFSSPFINPPESSSAGRKHKNKSINALGVNPYSMSQVGFAAGGLTPEGYTYPFRMVSKGKSRPVKPKDVAKKSREYELQLLKGGLASLGFTDAKDLNSVFGPNVQADFLAKKGGTPYLIDAKAGYNDAKLSQMEKKGATIAALRKTKAYKNYLQSLGMNDQEVRTAIVFGNAGTQQQKTLRKKGILRSAKGGISNYNGGGIPNYNRGQLFEREFAKATKSTLAPNAAIDFQKVNKKTAYESYDSRRTTNVDAYYGRYGHPHRLMLDKILRDKPSYWNNIEKAKGDANLGDVPYLEVLGQPKEAFTGVRSRKGNVPLSRLPSKRNQKKLKDLKIDPTKKVRFNWQKDSIATSVTSKRKAKGLKRKAKGFTPNFAKGGGGGKGGGSGGDGGSMGGGFAGKLLLIDLAMQPVISMLGGFGKEGSNASKSFGVVADSLNTFTTAATLGSIVTESKAVKKALAIIPAKYKILGGIVSGLILVGGKLKNVFKSSRLEFESLARRAAESAENLQKFNDSSSRYLSSFSDYTQAIDDGTADAKTIQRLNKNVQDALLKLPPQYRAQVASAPDFESLKEAVAKTSKELQDRTQGLSVLKDLAKEADGWFSKGDIVKSIGADKLAKQIGQGFNFESLVVDSGDGFGVSEQLTKALAGESLNDVIAAFNLTGEESQGLTDSLAGSKKSIGELVQSFRELFEGIKQSKEQIKLITELQKEQRSILAPLKKEIALLSEEARKSVPNLEALLDSFSTPQNRRDQEEGFREAASFLQSGVGSDEERISVFRDMQKFGLGMGREVDVDASLKSLNLEGAFEGIAKRQSDFLSQFSNLFIGGGVKIDPTNLSEALIGQAKGGLAAEGAQGKLIDSAKKFLDVPQKEEELLKRREVITKAFEDSVNIFDAAVERGAGTAGAKFEAKKAFNSAVGIDPNRPPEPTSSAKGFVPSFASARAEKQAASSGGYNAGKVFGMTIPGAGRVVANSAETVKQFPGMSQPAIMPPSFSKAGKNYAKAFSSSHGFDPYAAGGFVPNFSAAAFALLKSIVSGGAKITSKSVKGGGKKYINKDTGDVIGTYYSKAAKDLVLKGNSRFVAERSTSRMLVGATNATKGPASVAWHATSKGSAGMAASRAVERAAAATASSTAIKAASITLAGKQAQITTAVAKAKGLQKQAAVALKLGKTNKASRLKKKASKLLEQAEKIRKSQSFIDAGRTVGAAKRANTARKAGAGAVKLARSSVRATTAMGVVSAGAAAGVGTAGVFGHVTPPSSKRVAPEDPVGSADLAESGFRSREYKKDDQLTRRTIGQTALIGASLLPGYGIVASAGLVADELLHEGLVESRNIVSHEKEEANRLDNYIIAKNAKLVGSRADTRESFKNQEGFEKENEAFLKTQKKIKRLQLKSELANEQGDPDAAFEYRKQIAELTQSGRNKDKSSQFASKPSLLASSSNKGSANPEASDYQQAAERLRNFASPYSQGLREQKRLTLERAEEDEIERFEKDPINNSSVTEWIEQAHNYQEKAGKNILDIDAQEVASALINNNSGRIAKHLEDNGGKLTPEGKKLLADMYKQSITSEAKARKVIASQESVAKFRYNRLKRSKQESGLLDLAENVDSEGLAAHGFVPNFAGGESLARKTERRLTGSAIRSFDPRVGTYYRSAGQPASLDSLIRRDHPEGLSQAIKGSYSAQKGGTPNFAENSSVTSSIDGLVSKLDQLISTLGQESQAEQTTQQIQAGDVNVPLDIGGITINTNMESLMAEFTNQLGQVREEFSRKINAIPGSQNVKAKVPN